MGNYQNSKPNYDLNIQLSSNTQFNDLIKNYITHKTKQSLKFNKETLNILYPNKLFFIEKIYDWVKFVNLDKKFNLTNFINCMEILWLEPYKRNFNLYKYNYIYLELIISIILKTHPNDFPKKLKINEIYDILKFIVSIFIENLDDENIIFISLKNTFNDIFIIDKNNDKVNLNDFIFKFENLFSNLNVIKNILYMNIFNYEKDNKYLPIIYDSQMITKDMLLPLALNNNCVFDCKYIKKLYYCDNNSYKFNEFLDSFKNKNCPILILIKNEYKLDEEIKSEILGVYIKDSTNVIDTFFGHLNCYLFTLHPYIDFLNEKLDNIDEHFISIDYDKELNFGNNSILNKSRLSINKELNLSYANSYDDIFEEGYLSRSKQEFLNIKEIEVLMLCNMLKNNNNSNRRAFFNNQQLSKGKIESFN